MALKKKASVVADPPSPFEWVVKPSVGVIGTLRAKQTVRGPEIAKALPALVKWAIEKAYGLTPTGEGRYAETYNFDTLVWAEFTVKRFAVGLTTKHFGDGTFTGPDGIVYPVGTLSTKNYKPLACSGCYCTGLIIKKVTRDGGVGSIQLCPMCYNECTTVACKNLIYKAERAGFEGDRASKCSECVPVVKCLGCAKYVERASLSPKRGKYPKSVSGYVELCVPCADSQICEKCNNWTRSIKLTQCDGQRVCAACAKEYADRERLKFEKFDADEIPRHGKLTIPSLTARPFRTVSLETEVDGDKHYLSETMYNCGLVRVPQVEAYGTNVPETSQWAAFLKHDGSVTGGELITYLMDLSKQEHADALMDVMSKLRSLNKVGKVEYNANCGGHIHIDAHNFDQSNIWRLLTIWNYLEDVTFRLAGAGHKYGHRTLVPNHDRANGGNGYSNQTVKGPWGTKSAAGRDAQRQNRMCGLNFQPYFGAVHRCMCGAAAKDLSMRTCTCNLGKCTIEWRVWNTQANPRILHAWIAYMQAVHALADTDEEPTSDFEKDHPALGWTQKPWDKTTEAHKAEVYKRLEWMFGTLVFTEDERDSMLYTIQQSDIEVAPEYVEKLRAIEGPSAVSVVKPKPRNPGARQKRIVIKAPKPDADPFGNLNARERENAQYRAQRYRMVYR